MLAPILAPWWPRRHYPEYLLVPAMVVMLMFSFFCVVCDGPGYLPRKWDNDGATGGSPTLARQPPSAGNQASCCPAPRARVTRLRARSTARAAGGACSGAATTAPRSTSASASTTRWTAAAWISTSACNVILIFCKTYNYTRGASWCCWAAASPPAPRPPPPTTGA